MLEEAIAVSGYWKANSGLDTFIAPVLFSPGNKALRTTVAFPIFTGSPAHLSPVTRARTGSLTSTLQPPGWCSGGARSLALLSLQKDKRLFDLVSKTQQGKGTVLCFSTLLMSFHLRHW